MKKIGQVFLVFAFLMVLLTGCAAKATPATPTIIPSTATPVPTATPAATLTPGGTATRA